MCVTTIYTTTDVINVAGHRLSTGGIEEVLQSHPDVSECAVFGVKDSLKGRLPFGFIVVSKHLEDKPEEFARVEKECIQLVRKEIGPVAAFKLCKVIFRLPKTRSGKILRGTMQKIADGESYTVCVIIIIVVEGRVTYYFVVF